MSTSQELLLEKAVERKASTYAQSKGALVLKLNVIGRVGWPDRLYIYAGRLLFIEFKRKGEVLRPIQRHVAKLIGHHGFPAKTADTYEEAVELFNLHLGI